MIAQPYTSHIRKKTRNPIPQDENPVAKAAVFLPGEYAAVRNIIREIRQRLPKWTLSQKDPKVVEFTGGLGPGMWYAFPLSDSRVPQRLIRFDF